MDILGLNSYILCSNMDISCCGLGDNGDFFLLGVIGKKVLNMMLEDCGIFNEISGMFLFFIEYIKLV